MLESEKSAQDIQAIKLELEDYAKSTQHYKKYLQEIQIKLKYLSIFTSHKLDQVEIPTTNKIVHCILLTFYFSEILERCLESLFLERDRMDISVIENRSMNSDAIRKVVDKYRDKGLIKNHFIFNENIGANAFEITFDSNLLDLNYPFITVTDGDLIPDKSWLDEQITILNQCPEVFSVSTPLYYDNAPPKQREKAQTIPIQSKNSFYQECIAGWVLKTFRNSDWKDFIDFRKKHNIFFHDRSAYDYGKLYKHKKSVLTLNSKSYHLTWDYADSEYLTVKKSLGETTNNPWYHDRYSGFLLIRENQEELYCSAPPEVVHQKLSAQFNRTP
ncbi:glycosyl transferase 2 family protein [Lyngbya aestuarii BL J]|uniref:Glycosyl transferase 2 family protein n=1 Tax=Lyngbya aestuarii BL J TaxID=1348334 RepID=U7QJX0_9CYAN|nr:glycosyltransferase [Lyngbya aestuarii]ERT08193.1 glycosyl transferase 2 family protein [Lyngbya aestuarii BL J]